MNTNSERAIHRNEMLLRRWVEEVWNAGREEMIDELFAENGIAFYPYFLKRDERLRSRSDFKEFFRTVREQFCDLRVEIVAVSVEEDKAVAECLTNVTALQESSMPAGTRIEVRSLCLYKIRDGKISEIWNNLEVPVTDAESYRIDFPGGTTG